MVESEEFRSVSMMLNIHDEIVRVRNENFQLRAERDRLRELAHLMYYGLNQVPNTRINHKDFRNTYQLLAHVDKVKAEFFVQNFWSSSKGQNL